MTSADDDPRTHGLGEGFSVDFTEGDRIEVVVGLGGETAVVWGTVVFRDSYVPETGQELDGECATLEQLSIRRWSNGNDRPDYESEVATNPPAYARLYSSLPRNAHGWLPPDGRVASVRFSSDEELHGRIISIRPTVEAVR